MQFTQTIVRLRRICLASRKQFLPSVGVGQGARWFSSKDVSEEKGGNEMFMKVVSQSAVKILVPVLKTAANVNVRDVELNKALKEVNDFVKGMSSSPSGDGAYTMQLLMPNLKEITNPGFEVLGAEHFTTDKVARLPIHGVIGRYSAGKSFVLGQLLNVPNRKAAGRMVKVNGIEDAPEPKTNGIGFVLDDNVDRWFLDTEGSLAPAALIGDDDIATDIEGKKEATDDEIDEKLSLRKAKQFLLEGVVRRIADSIIVVLDRVTEDDQHMIFDMLKDVQAGTGQQIHVICNFREEESNENQRRLIQAAFRAKPKDIAPTSYGLAKDAPHPDIFKAQHGSTRYTIYALWKDYKMGVHPLTRNQRVDAAKDTHRNTSTLAVLSANISGQIERTLDAQLEPFVNLSPVIRVTQEMANVLPGVVTVTPAEKPKPKGVADAKNASEQNSAAKYGFKKVNKEPKEDALRFCVGKGDKIIKYRKFDRSAGLATSKLQIESETYRTKEGTGRRWDIAASGCELVVGETATPKAGGAYIKVWFNKKEKDAWQWEIRAKLRFAEKRGGQHLEIAHSIPVEKNLNRPSTTEEIIKNNQNGVLVLKAESVELDGW